MSSDDSGFDKEAEREKLREKYEQDRKDREATQRMSELLLQGATMTGKHCGECGDPIFRYDGQEFCPTCQREVDGESGGGESSDAARADEAPESRTADADQSVEVDVETPDERASRESTDAGGDGEPRVEINDVRVADRHVDREDVRDPPSQSGGQSADADGVGHRHGHRTGESGSRHGKQNGRTERGNRRRASDRSGDAVDTAAARESLVRTLNDLARRAEESDDVARTRDLLAATREAAEALDALDR